MIPTQCPSGQDPRMCAYCAHKDTCTNRCDLAKCDIIWGEISGDLADQTDLVAELDNRETAVRSDITANTNLITSLQTLTSQVESTANSALAIGATNTKRLDATEGVANTAKTLASANEKRLTETEGVANNASALAKTNATRLTATEGVANTAKALADSNAKRLTSTEGVANGADALSKENRKLISTVEGRETEHTNFSQVRLNIIDRRLYIVAPKGLLSENDKPVFARYIKSSIRQIINGTSYHYKRRGWIRPKHHLQGGRAYDYVPMIMKLDDSRWDRNTYDYFYILTAAQKYTYAGSSGDEYIEDVADDLWSQRKINYSKKLGVCIEREGRQITDYLHFSITECGGKPFLTRWSVGIKLV